MKFIKRHKKLLIFLGIIIFLSTVNSIFITYRFQLKPVVNFMIEHFVTNSCNGKKDCDEIRVLPKELQGKKIVFSPDAIIFFDPFNNNSEISLSELDSRGFLDTENFKQNGYEIIDPTLEKRGYLKNREYKIIRAVYHYNCSYCVDSSDYSFIIIEDVNGNRFTSLLNDSDISTNPWRDKSWDEYLPYYLNAYKNEETKASLINL